MLKVLAVIFTLLVCCYCLDNDIAAEDGRAKKKKGVVRLWAIVIMVVLAKVALVKLASVFLFTAFFQKLFYLGGLFLKHFLKNQGPSKAPQQAYGPPEYNTVGYSYGPPDHEVFPNEESLPSITEIGVNWLLNRNTHS